MKEKRNIKYQFISALREFVQDLQAYSSDNTGQWTIKGFIDVFKNVYTISADTKIVSKIIEIHLFPKILDFAVKNSYRVVLAEHQNWYPDMSLVCESDPSIKFALDIKTTYRDPEFLGHCNGFTLGSHGEYFTNRDSTKNIQYPYREYLAHICLGVIYTRSDLANVDETQVFRVWELGEEPTVFTPNGALEGRILEADRLRSISSVVKDFQFFVREKWEIASDSSGSGNTANIGSITKIDDIVNGNGVFKKLGEKWFDDYWMNYGKITVPGKDGKPRKIRNLKEFLKYRGKDPSPAYPKAKKSRRLRE